MLIEKKNINVFPTDDQKTLIKKISVYLNTLPRFISIDKQDLENFIKTGTKVRVENYLEIIKDKTWGDVEKQISKFDIEEKEAKNVYIAYLDNTRFEDIEYMYLIFGIEKMGKGFGEFENIFSSRGDIIKKIDNELAKNKQFVFEWNKSQEEIMSVYEKKEIENMYTEFQKEKIDTKFYLNIENFNYDKLFDSIQLSERVPYVVYKDNIKIFKKMIIDENLEYDKNKDVIYCYVNVREDIRNVYIEKLEISHDNKGIYMKFEHDLDKKNIKSEGIIKIFDELFPDLNLNLNNIINSKDILNLKGMFYIPGFELNKYVLNDLIMNDTLYSNFIIDEKVQTEKERVIFSFSNRLTGEVFASITPDVVLDNTDILLKKFPGKFSNNMNYVRVRVNKVEDYEKIEEFQKFLSTYMILYTRRKDDIIDFYKQFIPDFNKKSSEGKTGKKSEKLKYIVPEIFLNRYSKLCHKIPKIVPDSELDQGLETYRGLPVLKFPAKGEMGLESRNYICTDEEYKYPGLRDNPMINKDSFPYIPCCYTQNQLEIEGSKLRHYLFDEKLSKHKDIQQDIFKTNKILPKNKVGVIEYNTKTFLKGISDINDKVDFLRLGMFSTKNSFIECLLTATIPDFEKENDPVLKIRNVIKDIVSDIPLLQICKQELYDMTTEDIRDYLLNDDRYKNPHLLVSLFEEYFKCNIYVFTEVDGIVQLSIPRHSYNYYNNKKYGKTILLYEHKLMSDSQCELICESNVKNKKIQNKIFTQENFTKQIKNVFDKLTKTFYIQDKEHNIFTIPNEYKLFEQYIDEKGKCRLVNIQNNNGTKISIITSPIQPLRLKNTKEPNIYFLEINSFLQEFPKFKKINEDEQHYHIIYKDSKFKIMKKYDRVSLLEKFRKNKKIAKLLSEYILRLYSIFLDKQPEKNNIDENVNKFFNKHVFVDENFIYKDDYLKISFDNFFIKEEKIILNSEILYRKFWNMLYHVHENKQNILQNYKNLNNLQYFYKNLDDYKVQKNHTILKLNYGLQSKWKNIQKNTFNIYSQITSKYKSPFLLNYKLQNIPHRNFIVYRSTNIFDAINISKNWHEKKYFDETKFNKYNEIKFSLYNYIEYKKQEILTFNSKNVILLAYKHQNIAHFLSLLPI
jgi:hypothetical protein